MSVERFERDVRGMCLEELLRSVNLHCSIVFQEHKTLDRDTRVRELKRLEILEKALRSKFRTYEDSISTAKSLLEREVAGC